MSATGFIEPAFPCLEVNDTGNVVRQNFGLTVRDYFAAKAMQAGLTGATLPGLTEGAPATLDALNKAAVAFYTIADAMLLARAG